MLGWLIILAVIVGLVVSIYLAYKWRKAEVGSTYQARLAAYNEELAKWSERRPDEDTYDYNARMRRGPRKPERDSKMTWGPRTIGACIAVGVFGFFFVVFGIATVSWNTGAYNEALNYKPMVQEYNYQVGKKQEMVDFISNQLGSYGPYEKSIFDSVDSNIILNYPQINNDKVLQSKVAQIVGINQDLVTKGNAIINLQAEICKNNDNILIPKVWFYPDCALANPAQFNPEHLPLTLPPAPAPANG